MLNSLKAKNNELIREVEESVKQILELTFINGYTAKEIASQLKCSISNVYKHTRGIQSIFDDVKVEVV